MKPAMNINNKYFMYTILGVVLLIGAMGFALANFARVVKLDLSAVTIVGALAVPAISLLTSAIKADKHRLGDEQRVNA